MVTAPIGSLIFQEYSWGYSPVFIETRTGRVAIAGAMPCFLDTQGTARIDFDIFS
jgi:hypothetical protein